MNNTGRSPDGSGYSAEPEPSCTVSAVPVSIPNAATFNIAITPDLGAAAAGELLLSYINDEERWGYATREFLRGNFREVDGLPPLDIRTICCGCWANSPGEGDKVSWWRSDDLGLDVFLHWDGDGTVVFQCPAWTLENGDCKNDGDWEWVGADHWSVDYRHYEDDASAIETGTAKTEGLGPQDESAAPKVDAQPLVTKGETNHG